MAWLLWGPVSKPLGRRGPWGELYQLLISVILMNMSAASPYRRCDKSVQASSKMIWWVLVSAWRTAYLRGQAHQAVCLRKALWSWAFETILHDLDCASGVMRHPE